MSKLEEMLKYVSEHNEFYKNRIKEYGIKDPLDITQWPILTRKELQENRYNMFSDGYKSKYFNQQLRRQSSSGSSGVPVNVYWDYKDWYASNMSLWRKRLQWYGINPSDRCVMFTLNIINHKMDDDTVICSKEYNNILNINVSIIQNDDEYIPLIDLIEKFIPKWIYIQPFILKKLLNVYQKLCKTFPRSVSYIECVGEILDYNLKKEAQNYFDVPIVNMYGSEEMNSIGFECRNYNMHILTDNVYVEIKNSDGIFNFGEGEAIITNLNNRAMPLIRYNQGDIISVNTINDLCICSSSSKSMQTINNIKGRVYEIVKVNEKIEINPLMLLEMISEVMNEYGNIITSYRYVFERAKKELQCIISIKENKKRWYQNIRKAIETNFNLKCSFKNDISFSVVLSNDNNFYNKKIKILDIK